MTGSYNIKFFLYAVFFFSGLSSLIYEVLWMRMLTLTFGTTVFAASTVITVFMLGLALGSYYVGVWIDKNSDSLNLLRVYALIELSIGAYCFLTPWLFSNLDMLYGYIYTLGEINFYLFSIIRFLFSLLVLFIPTFLMGSTLPLLSKYLVTHRDSVGKEVGVLYGINTLGAVFGVLMTAFIFIPMLGVKSSLLLAVVFNVLIASVVYFLSKSELGDRLVSDVSSKSGKATKKSIKPKGNVYSLVLIAFVIAGFTSLAYEVSWFRILTMTIGNTAYAFSVMLATFLVGIALGSYFLSIYIDRIKDCLIAFAVVEMMIALFSVCLMPLFGSLPLVFLDIVEQLGFSFWSIQVVNFFTAFVVIILPTLLMGAAFPLVVKLITVSKATVGRGVGSAYAGNTLGGVLGSLFAGFLFIPFLGVQNTIILLAVINASLALWLIFNSLDATVFLKRGLSFSALIVILLSFVLPQWDRVLLTSGVYVRANNYKGFYEEGDFAKLLNEVYNIVYYDEGITGTVAVVERSDDLLLSVNGKNIADVKNDSATHIQLGSLPLMLHPDPENALLIGLGSGVTLGAIETFPLKEIDTVEISKEVVDASRYFSNYNRNALDDKRLNMIIDDGRTHLSYSGKEYDVIVSQPSVPWMPGAANLYTEEFYRSAKKSLSANGIMCQWIQAYGMDLENLKSLINTFVEVFPNSSLWTYRQGNIFLVGLNNSDSIISYETIAKNFSKKPVNSALTRANLYTLDKFVAGFTLGGNALKSFVDGTPLNTYDNPIAEFSVPKTLFSFTNVENYNAIAKYTALVRPKIDIGLSKTGGEQEIPFAGLKISMGDNWGHGFAGFEIKNLLIPNDPEANKKQEVPKAIARVFEFKRGGLDRIVTPPEDMIGYVAKNELEVGEGWYRLKIERIRKSDLEKFDIEKFHKQRALGVAVGTKKKTIKGNPFIWSYSYISEIDRILTLNWHCRENDFLYTSWFYPVYASEKENKKIIDEIMTGFSCIKR